VSRDVRATAPPSEHGDVGDIFLPRGEIASRVVELGAG